jgi:hypothetical protein
METYELPYVYVNFLHSLKTPPNLLVMPVQRPFNEHALWQGKIQRANYATPHEKPPMVLPKISSHGGTIKDPTAPPIWEEINNSYTKYSSSYWTRVKDSHNKYRIQYYSRPQPSYPFSFSPYQRKQDLTCLSPHVSLEEHRASLPSQFS